MFQNIKQKTSGLLCESNLSVDNHILLGLVDIVKGFAVEVFITLNTLLVQVAILARKIVVNVALYGILVITIATIGLFFIPLDHNNYKEPSGVRTKLEKCINSDSLFNLGEYRSDEAKQYESSPSEINYLKFRDASLAYLRELIMRGNIIGVLNFSDIDAWDDGPYFRKVTDECLIKTSNYEIY